MQTVQPQQEFIFIGNMKRVTLLLFLILSIGLAFGQKNYTYPVKYFIRKSSTENLKPDYASFFYKGVKQTNAILINEHDSIGYKLSGVNSYPAYKIFTKSGTNPTTYTRTTTTGSYGSTVYPIYIRTSNVANNIPPKSNFTQPNMWCWETKTGKIYEKVNNVVVWTKSIYTYNSIAAPSVITCTFDYTAFGDCQPDGYKYRAVADSSPDNCNSGTPVLRQACTYIPPPPVQELADWFVSTATNTPPGNDSNSGDSLHPFLTWQKACSVASAGDLIFGYDGLYIIESTELIVPVVVSLVGQSLNTIIESHYYAPGNGSFSHASILLSSSTPGTNGNQSIKNLRITGGATLQGSRAILIRNRGHVTIENCTIDNYFVHGVAMTNSYLATAPIPPIYEVGNKIINCTINNCTDQAGTWDGGGLINISCQDSLDIHGNTLTQNSREEGHNGNIINAGMHHFKNLKIHDNIMTKPDFDGLNVNGMSMGWNCFIEMWKAEGGIQIYNNQFLGGAVGIDAAGVWSLKGDNAYSYSIHDNLFQPISGFGYDGYANVEHRKRPIIIEGYTTENVLIYNNHFKNLQMAVEIFDQKAYPTGCNVHDISIYNNLIENCGRGGHSDWYDQAAIVISSSALASISSVNHINVYNNTITGDPLTTAHNAIDVISNLSYSSAGYGNIHHVNIKNNIISGFGNYPIEIKCNYGLLDNIHIGNNLLTKPTSGYLSCLVSTGTIPMTNYTYTNNLPANGSSVIDPLFVSPTDFHLQAGSPCINTGINVGLPFTGSAPDMGFYESPY